MSKYTFQVSKQYKHSEIKYAIGLDAHAKGGPWDTGYAERNGADFVFCNVGAAGRTGHDYDNYFDGQDEQRTYNQSRGLTVPLRELPSLRSPIIKDERTGRQ